MHQPSQEESGGTGLLIGGFISAVIALFLVPIVFGPIGIYCGYKAREKGRDGGGLAVMILSVATMVLGMIIGAIVGFSAFA